MADHVQIDRIANRLQHAVGLINLIERQMAASLEDLRRASQSLSVATEALAELRANNGKETR
jgi:hypothetical protein